MSHHLNHLIIIKEVSEYQSRSIHYTHPLKETEAALLFPNSKTCSFDKEA